MKEQRSIPQQPERLQKQTALRPRQQEQTRGLHQSARLALRAGEGLEELSPQLLEELARALGNQALTGLLRGDGPPAPRFRPADVPPWPAGEPEANDIHAAPPRLCGPAAFPGRDGLWPPPTRWTGGLTEG